MSNGMIVSLVAMIGALLLISPRLFRRGSDRARLAKMAGIWIVVIALLAVVIGRMI